MNSRNLLNPFLSIFFLSLLFTFACKKNNSGGYYKMHLRSLTWYNIEPRTYGDSLYFWWSKDLSHVTQLSFYSNTRHTDFPIRYDINGNISQVQMGAYVFNYTNNVQGEIVHILGVDTLNAVYDTIDISLNYSGGKVSQIIYYRNKPLGNESKFERYTMTWSGDNIVQIDRETKAYLNDAYVFVQKYNYTYDNKINPMQGFYFLFYFYNRPMDLVEMYSKNNITSWNVKINWEYNILQYPVKRIGLSFVGYTDTLYYNYYNY